MIAYIDLPLRGTNITNGHDILVVALVLPTPNLSSAQAHVIYIDQDGSLGEASISEVNINWRFDDRRRRWVDVDTGEELDDDGDGQN